MKQLRVMMVEDSADDCELMKIALEKGGYEVSSDRVENEKVMMAAIERNKYDVILSDHQMPGFNSREALAVMKKLDVEAPFILVSGKIGETGAVELMKAGASDYVSKNHLALLPAAVERALDEHKANADRKHAEDAVRKSEKRWKLLVTNIPDYVAILDDDDRYIFLNHYAKGYSEKDVTGNSVYDYVEPKSIPIFRDALKWGRSENKKQEFEHKALGDEGTYRLFEDVAIPITEEDGVSNIIVVSHDITDRRAAEKEQARSYRQLELTLEGTVNALSAVGEHRDPYTAGHQERVTQLACAIAEEMKLSPEIYNDIRIAGKLHDIGKIEIPSEILSKPGRLTDIEFSMVKVHSRVGFDILKTAELPCQVAEIVLRHHERIDGSGYPNGLKADDIQIGAKIMAVADVVEAMSSHRPYRAALGIDKALEEIEQNKGKLYDPEVVDACLKLFRKKGFKF
ncbi:MAG: HD domain-containing phosphohydrolase [Actinomycetota bacterium]